MRTDNVSDHGGASDSQLSEASCASRDTGDKQKQGLFYSVARKEIQFKGFSSHLIQLH